MKEATLIGYSISAVFINWQTKEVWLNSFVGGPDDLDFLISKVSEPETENQTELVEYNVIEIII